MATARRQQEVAAERVSHLPPDQIRCRLCGESTASTPSMKGYAHRFGPTGAHRFIAATPKRRALEVGR